MDQNDRSRLMRDTKPLVSPHELGEIERRLGVKLPADYGSFLLKFNGGQPSPGWFHYGTDDGDWAEVTRFWSAEQMESESQRLREYLAGSATEPDERVRRYVVIGAVAEEDDLVIDVSSSDRGGVFWNANADYFAPTELTCVANSFTAFWDRLGYVPGTQPWMRLIDAHDLEGLQRWLDTGGSAQAREDVVLGVSALEWAQSLNRHDMVALLISRGAKPRQPWWKFWA